MSSETPSSRRLIEACVRRQPSASLSIGLLLIIALTPITSAIQCYSGSQLQIIECPGANCIKQSMGLDTVRYCDGTGTSSICQTYSLTNTCKSLPNMGTVCCCGEQQLCNRAPSRHSTALFVSTAVALLATLCRW